MKMKSNTKLPNCCEFLNMLPYCNVCFLMNFSKAKKFPARYNLQLKINLIFSSFKAHIERIICHIILENKIFLNPCEEKSLIYLKVTKKSLHLIPIKREREREWQTRSNKWRTIYVKLCVLKYWICVTQRGTFICDSCEAYQQNINFFKHP